MTTFVFDVCQSFRDIINIWLISSSQFVLQVTDPLFTPFDWSWRGKYQLVIAGFQMISLETVTARDYSDRWTDNGRLSRYLFYLDNPVTFFLYRPQSWQRLKVDGDHMESSLDLFLEVYMKSLRQKSKNSKINYLNTPQNKFKE